MATAERWEPYEPRGSRTVLGARGCDSHARLAYLHAYDSPADAKAGIDGWMAFYNETRPHQALDNRTPADVYSGANGRWACGRPATPAGWTGPGLPDGPGPAQPATTSPPAGPTPGLDAPPPKSATIILGDMPTNTHGSLALTP